MPAPRMALSTMVGSLSAQVLSVMPSKRDDTPAVFRIILESCCLGRMQMLAVAASNVQMYIGDGKPRKAAWAQKCSDRGSGRISAVGQDRIERQGLLLKP
ncbi:hypothetical protein IWZ03DRAFT_383150 [Phyllosticta citriasiana]|uniref:Uncharacterized protein n=1 Tax=Phyllosticta citriasiana TaxID=595635 RepID=A0ABR1KHW7_9PEZI